MRGRWDGERQGDINGNSETAAPAFSKTSKPKEVLDLIKTWPGKSIAMTEDRSTQQ